MSATACRDRSSSASKSRRNSLTVKAISVVPAVSARRCAAATATRHGREPHQTPHASVQRLRYEPRLILLSSETPNNAAVTASTSADTPHATIYGCSNSILRHVRAETDVIRSSSGPLVSLFPASLLLGTCAKSILSWPFPMQPTARLTQPMMRPINMSAARRAANLHRGRSICRTLPGPLAPAEAQRTAGHHGLRPHGEDEALVRRV
jgi:hypothetical protein